MAKFRKVPESETIDQLQFNCPGCKDLHAVNTTWSFNGDFEKPTVNPSVLVTWKYWSANNGFINNICHSYIKDGMIQFLDDCTHELKGQTVELPDIDKPPLIEKD